MPRSNFRPRVAVSYSAEPLPKPDTTSITSPALIVSPTHCSTFTSLDPAVWSSAPSRLETVTHIPHAPYWGEATQVLTSNCENGRWSIGTESRKFRSPPLSGLPLTHRRHFCSWSPAGLYFEVAINTLRKRLTNYRGTLGPRDVCGFEPRAVFIRLSSELGTVVWA